MVWDYQCTAFRNDCTEQFSIDCNCIHSEKENTIDWSENSIQHISEHFINNGISKTQTVTLSYSSFSHCTGLYTEFRLNKQLHLSWISWTSSGFRWQTDWNDEKDYNIWFLWKAEFSIIMHEIWQVQLYNLFKRIFMIITASHNCKWEQIPNILTEWEWISCDEVGEWCEGGNVQWMSGSIQSFPDLKVSHSHQCWGDWNHISLQIHSQIYIQKWKSYKYLFQ